MICLYNISRLRVPSFYLLLLALCLSATACKKFVEVSPPSTAISSASVYESDATAGAPLTSVYADMTNSVTMAGGLYGISLTAGLSADELTNYMTANITLSQYYSNALNKAYTYFWNEPYQYIYVANATLEGLNASTTVSGPVKQQLTGEAEFVRAFMNFYLVNLVGDVPLALTTNYEVNNVAKRTPAVLVYQQIVADLTEAQENLSSAYLTASGGPTPDKIRPNSGAAAALLARVYLYTGKWDSAEMEATAVIGNTANYHLVANLDSVFLSGSTEAIWQLEPTNPGYNTYDEITFVMTSGPNSVNPVALSPFLLNAFAPGDQRLVNWVGVDSSTGTKYYYPYKYKVGFGQTVTEYQMVLRLAEQYLIRAEARAMQGELPGALSDLNAIRTRAGLPDTTVSSAASLIQVITHERQVELFTEWGDRWLNLKRTAAVDSVMTIVSPQKGGAWSTNWQLYPIPQSQLIIDPNLTENTGY